jgi:2-iminobutanoate/2-iminopropanoate deaminase
VLKGNTIFISGQIALEPKSMELNNASIKDETHQVMLNLKNILKEVNMDFNNVLKSSIFLSDMSLFNEVNEIYGSYLESGNEPARETIAVKALPMSVNVEISMIAAI